MTVHAADRGDALTPNPPADAGSTAPATLAQQALWLHHELSPATITLNHNLGRSVRLHGELDRDALDRALTALDRTLTALANRQASLRTTFTEIDGALAQVIRAPAPVAWATLDLRGTPDGADEVAAQRLVDRLAARPYDPSTGPLFRATLLRTGEAEHVLVLDVHHTVADAWSIQILMRELAALYSAFARGEHPVLPPLPETFADHARSERALLESDRTATALEYWSGALAGAPAASELPPEESRGPHGTAAPRWRCELRRADDRAAQLISLVGSTDGHADDRLRSRRRRPAGALGSRAHVGGARYFPSHFSVGCAMRMLPPTYERRST
jgi:hypothetical protein